MKILIVNNNLEVGGIQKALVNLLKEIADRHEITLFLFSKQGALLKDVPQNVKILTGNRFTEILGMSQADAAKKGFFSGLWRGAFAALTRLFGTKYTFSLLCAFQKIKDAFDVSISYMQNSDFKVLYGGCNEFVLKCTKAKQKIAFIHCDFSAYPGNNPYNLSVYQAFSKIACVSEGCKNRFLSVTPKSAKKTFVVHNCFAFSDMQRESALLEAERSNNKLNLLTVARMSEEKGINRMFPILEALKSEGFSFVWRIVGNGPLYNDAVFLRGKYGLEKEVVFLGQLENPYPYFKTADLLVVPSYNEAAPMVFGEAAFFSLPILTTNTVSALELVEKKGIGIVCENEDEQIKNALRACFSGITILNAKKDKSEATNEQAVQEFENLVLGERE